MACFGGVLPHSIWAVAPCLVYSFVWVCGVLHREREKQHGMFWWSSPTEYMGSSTMSCLQFCLGVWSSPQGKGEAAWQVLVEFSTGIWAKVYSFVWVCGEAARHGMFWWSSPREREKQQYMGSSTMSCLQFCLGVWSSPQGKGEAARQVLVEFCCRVLLAILALQITLGRATREQSIDVDLSLEGPAWKISRRQGVIKLRNNGDFFIANEGKRPIHIDGKPVLAGNKQKLFDNSVVEVGTLIPCYPVVITIPVTKRGTLDPPCPSTSTSTKAGCMNRGSCILS